MSFKTPDGKTFDNKAEWKKHYLSLLRFEKKTGETLRVNAPIVNGQGFKMNDLKDCTAMLLDHSETVNCDRLTNCKVFIGACCSSVFIRNCTDCEFTVACQQLRTRDCKNVQLNLFAKTDPVIEASTGHVFRNFNGAYKGLAEHFKEANLDPEENVWDQIFDFHKGNSTYPEPHFTKIDTPKALWAIDGADSSDNPVPSTSTASDAKATSDDSGIKSFTFDTTQEEAEAALAASAPPPPTAAAAVSAYAASAEAAPPLPGAIGAADAAAADTPAPTLAQDPLLVADVANAAALAGFGEIDAAAIEFVLSYYTA